MMKSFTKSAVVLACLLSPLVARATPITTEDSYYFELSNRSNVSFGYLWSDPLLTNPGSKNTKEFDLSSLAWTLTGSSGTTGASVDLSSTSLSQGTLLLNDLAAGSYTLKLTGSWAVEGQSNNWTVARKASVELNEPSIKAVAVNRVPEPGTYAMLLAGLGLMGAVARRRRQA